MKEKRHRMKAKCQVRVKKMRRWMRLTGMMRRRLMRSRLMERKDKINKRKWTVMRKNKSKMKRMTHKMARMS